jgi:hypothetical protein
VSHDDRAAAVVPIAVGTAGVGADEQPATTATAQTTRSRRFIATAGPFVRRSPGADAAIRPPTIRAGCRVCPGGTGGKPGRTADPPPTGGRGLG